MKAVNDHDVRPPLAPPLPFSQFVIIWNDHDRFLLVIPSGDTFFFISSGRGKEAIVTKPSSPNCSRRTIVCQLSFSNMIHFTPPPPPHPSISRYFIWQTIPSDVMPGVMSSFVPHFFTNPLCPESILIPEALSSP
ncbi:hypothetical protein CDAR_43971 [Caerostris darwini]|uniref:Uncharacterized protein n=1 Tax=Caerostris darwini TaxID=1538125 RepID=A0AAV4WIX8_9ARAC|nr:hypothetical protein CDAR_43971 [Caerostris darwini]